MKVSACPLAKEKIMSWTVVRFTLKLSRDSAILK